MMVLLCILDGFGLREPTPDNAVAAAHKPVFDSLMARYRNGTLDGSGEAVGLPDGQMGNSEVGHLNLGAGRVIYQDVTRIDKAIREGEFFTNSAFLNLMANIREQGRSLHLFGLCSDGKVHSSLDHLYALLKLAKNQRLEHVWVHVHTDGRDTPPESGQGYVAEIEKQLSSIGIGRIATVGGRYYGMDRDKRWERTTRHYRAMVFRDAPLFPNASEGIRTSYASGVTDEFIEPFCVRQNDDTAARIVDGDGVICFNFRADRVRQPSYLLLKHDIDGVNIADQPTVSLVTMTQYATNLIGAVVAFPPQHHQNILGEVLAAHGRRQLRTAETEKYPHVTFFFNGGVEQPFDGEERILVPSPKVATYDLQPEMSSVEVTDRAVAAIDSGAYDFVLLNYANPDMVGHTGVFEAAKSAIEAVDIGLGRLLAAVERQNGVAIVTADHGNAEMMIDPNTGGPWTAHTTNLVPYVVVDPHGHLGDSVSVRPAGILADVAPTVLDLLGLPQPPDMTGTTLLVRA